MMGRRRRLKIAYATMNDVSNQSSFNVGTRYYIGNYLAMHLGDVDFIGPLDSIEDSIFYRYKGRIYKNIFGRRYLPQRAPKVLDHFARQIQRKIEGKEFDLIFAPDSIVISHLDTSIPIVFYVDAIFDAMIDFYPAYTNLCKETIRDGHNQEQAALDNAMLALYSSQWAVDATIENFDVDPNKVKFIPFGSNLPVVPEKGIVTRRKPSETCNLLFIGVDWERKGGPIAVQVVDRLNRMGLKSKLFACSLLPKGESLNEYVEFIGLLDRGKVHENRELENLFSICHFLILPTRADCTPGVFREAAAFGLPVVTTDVGGIGSVVENRKNGIVLSVNASPEEYASVVLSSFKNAKDYLALRLGSREMFDQALNWDSSIARVSSLVREFMERL